jgi:hypothetical protein
MTLYASLVTVNMTTRFACQLKPVALGNSRQQRATFARWFFWLCSPTSKWTAATRVADAWRRRNRFYFNDYNRWWYGLVDLWSVIVVGVINGIKVSTRPVCAAQIGAMLLLFLVVLAMGIWFDLCTSRSLRYYLNISNALGLLSSCFLVAGVRTDNVLLVVLSSWTILLVSAISLLKLMVDLLFVIFQLTTTSPRLT